MSYAEYYYAACFEREGQVCQLSPDIAEHFPVEFYGVYKMTHGEGSEWIADYATVEEAIAVTTFMNKCLGVDQ